MNTVKSRFLLACVLLSLISQKVMAYADTASSRVTATVILPLYLDSMFKYGSFKYGKNIPKFALPALEFYNGVQLAADSLRQEGIEARIEVIDSKDNIQVQKMFASYNKNKPMLMIGVMQNATELRTVATKALNNSVPFISATYPNDGGINNNPELLIVNSTLRTHCFSLYEFVQKNTKNDDNLLLVTRKEGSGADERIKAYLTEAGDQLGGRKLKWKTLSLSDSFSVKQLTAYLDSNKFTSAIGATLDMDFSQRLIRQLSGLRPSYESAVYGMPTWDELSLTKSEYKGVDVYYSTAFVSYSANAKVYSSITNKFKKIANSRPSDMVFKGFELTYRYVKTLAQHPNDFLGHVNDSQYKLFADFNFKEVPGIDGGRSQYLENKKLYFVKKTDGLVKGVY